MAVLKMDSSPNDGLRDAKGDLAASVASSVVAQRTAVRGLGTPEDVRSEIDDVLADMRAFHSGEPDTVMQAVSAHSARLVELIIRIQRIEVIRREWKPVREECERVLGELKSQFQVASRMLAQRRDDWEMSGRGQT